MVRGKNEEVSRERGDSREGETSPLQMDFTPPPPPPQGKEVLIRDK